MVKLIKVQTLDNKMEDGVIVPVRCLIGVMSMVLKKLTTKKINHSRSMIKAHWT
jgi:hypothetical protein